MSYNSGSVTASILGDVRITPTGIQFLNNVTGAQTGSSTAFTVPANKKWTIYRFTNTGTASAATLSYAAAGNVFGYAVTTTTIAANTDLDLTNMPIELAAGETITIDSGGASVSRYSTIYYKEEDV